MTLAIEVEGLRVRYRSQERDAVDGLTLTLEGGKVYGLLGRNGAGKTTVLSVLAAFRRPTAGSVRIGGRPVFENPAVTREVCLVPDGDAGGEPRWRSENVGDVLDLAACLRPRWDVDYAHHLLARFGIPNNMAVKALSRGKQAAVRIVVGLASRAAVTMFDEPHLGLDAPSRLVFYDELLADFMAHPRTIVLSTHLIEEVAGLFEQVVIIDQGRLVAHRDVEGLCAQGAAVTGPVEAVDRFTEGLRVLNDKTLGPTKAVMVYGELDAARRAQARRAGLEVGPVALQDLFVHLTEPSETPR
ncbi:MAG: ABC transporter ATP-binding protein [Egibacteraceae bacterium]